MHNSILFYPKLAADNLKKNSKTYLPYLISGIFCATVYYILRSLSLNPSLRNSFGGFSIHAILQMGSDVSALFILVLLFYTNSFLMKQRKKEFALLNTLGMGKRHIAKMLLFEMLYTFFITVSCGLILGILLDKLTFLIVTKFIHSNVELGFFISPTAIIHVLLLFFISSLFIFVKSVWTLHILNPTQLLRESKAGEKEPKAKWILAILGGIILLCGYWIALSVKNPIQAIPSFFIAAILVIIATFLLFTAGSIALLKLLRHNKNFYYKTNHFVSISGLMYRMKQNAIGLASICILSTMVLVMISSTGSLMIGLEDMINERYPNDFNFEISETNSQKVNEFIKVIHTLQKNQDFSVTEDISYHFLNLTAAKKENEFVANTDFMDQSVLMFIPLEDYNTVTGENKILKDGEVFIHTKRMEWNAPTIGILGNNYTVKEKVSDYPKNGAAVSNIADYIYLICTENDFETLYQNQLNVYGSMASQKKFYYGFDTDANEQSQKTLLTKIHDLYDEYMFSCENKLIERDSFMGLFGGLFFIGIFLGLLFTVATVLIIYYKQISEGYNDRERFIILQKVGMSQKEVKKSIHSQIITVFFLPLLFAGLHLTIAFPILTKLLKALGLIQTSLFASISICSFLVFACFYIIVYFFTAKTYYQIIKR